MHKATIVILVSLFLGACAAGENEPQAAAESAAETFLTSLDRGDYQGLWSDASPLLRARVSQDDWATNLRSNRQPLGALDHRELTSIEFHASLEEMPDGEYAILTYTSAFSENPGIEEVVGLALDAESQWRVIGYYVH